MATDKAGKSAGKASARGTENAPQDLLDDLCARFIFNAPEEELASFERILFHVEQAWWFYDDEYCDSQPQLRRFQLRDFAVHLFERCPALKPYCGDLNAIYAAFTAYKHRVPVYGVILLDPSMEQARNGTALLLRCFTLTGSNQVLLVKGWSASSAWAYPRGKVNGNEAEMECAAREVHEEVGLEVRSLLSERDTVAANTKDQRQKMFVAYGIPSDTPFAPQLRKEISGIMWHRVADLPKSMEAEYATKGHKFFNMWRFTAPLQRWIDGHQRLRGIVRNVTLGGPSARGDVPADSPAASGESPADTPPPQAAVDRPTTAPSPVQRPLPPAIAALRLFRLDARAVMAAYG